jgi:hypothetical protein
MDRRDLRAGLGGKQAERFANFRNRAGHRSNAQQAALNG